MVVIRLARGGAKKRPFFNIVVADSRTRRDGRFIERVGFYNPVAAGGEQPLRVALDRVDALGEHGAQLSPTVARLVDAGQDHGLSAAAAAAEHVAAGRRRCPGLPDDAVEVGRIVDAWGIKGWIKVLPYASDPQALFASQRWFLQPPERARGRCRRHAAAARRRRRGSTATASSPARRKWPTATPPRRCTGARIFVARSQLSDAGRRRVLLGRPDRPGGRQPRGRGARHGGRPDRHRPAQRAARASPMRRGPAMTAERLIPFVAAYVDSVDLAARRSSSTGAWTTDASTPCASTSSRCFRNCSRRTWRSGVTRRAFETGQVDVQLWPLRDFADGALPPRRRPALRRRAGHGDAGRAAGSARWPRSQADARRQRAGGGPLHADRPAHSTRRWCASWPPAPARCCCAAATRASTSAFIDRHVDLELSLGDFVLSGGEIAGAGAARRRGAPAARRARRRAVAPAGQLLGGRPARLPALQPARGTAGEGRAAVPPVLLSGHHAEIARWRREHALELTARRRPDLIAAARAAGRL